MIDRAPGCIDCGSALAPGYPSMLCARCMWSGEAPEEAPKPVPSGVSAMRVPGHDILEEIARGGMGVVYRARERETQRTVALKMLRPRLADEEGMRERFRLEASAVAALEHPSILPVYRVDEADDMPFFTMKLAAGGTLAERKEKLRGQWREIAALFVTLAGAVQYAHQHGVLHRDLKPPNVLFDDAGKAYLTDFGLVKLIDAVSELTGSQSFLGTPHYSAPEVAAANAGAATVASDLWSLGAMLYELLTGRLPFDAEGLVPLLRCITDEAPAPFSAAEAVPRDLRVITLKCLQKDPAQRYASAADFAADLRAWLEGHPITARAASLPERVTAWAKRNPLPSAMAAALAVSLAILTVLLAREYRASQRAAMESRLSENTARVAEAGSLLQETRAKLRDGQWVDRSSSIEAVLRAHSLRPSGEARDVLLSLLALPLLEKTGEVPYTGSRPVFFSGDLSRYLTVEPGATAVRDTATRKVLSSIPEIPGVNHPPGPLSRDGTRLILRGSSRTAVWDTATRRELVTLASGFGFPCFSPDGSSASAGLCVARLNQTPPSSVTLTEPEYGCRSLSPDGRHLLIAHNERPELKLCSSDTGAVVREYSAAGSHMIHSSAWQSDGLAFFTGMVDGKLARWSLTSSTPDWIVPAHTDGVDDMALFDDDRHLITQGRDGQTKIWDLRTLTTVLTLPWGGLRVIASDDGQHLALDCKPEKKSHLYRFTPPPVCTLVRLPPSPVSNSYYQGEATVLPDSDGQGFAVTSGHDIHLLGRDGTLKESLRCGRCDGLARDPSGTGFVRISSANRKSQVYRVPPGRPGPGDDTRLLTGVWPGTFAGITNHPVTNNLLVGAGDRMSTADAAPGVKLQFTALKPAALETGAILSAIAYSPSGRLLARAGTDRAGERQRRIHIHKTEGPPGDTAIATATFASALAFTADETALLAGDGNFITCHDLTTGRIRWQISHQRPFDRDVHARIRIAVAARTGTIAAALAPETVSLLDPLTGTILRTFRHPTGRTIRGIGISPDGTRLVAAGSYLVQVWRLDAVEEELAKYGMTGRF